MAALLSALPLLNLCSETFAPLLFGWIGDNMGQVNSDYYYMMMVLSCLVMAILPTYEQIGF